MKTIAKIFIIAGLVLAAGQVEAITIRGFTEPIGPESLGLQVPNSEDYQYSDLALRSTLSPNLTPEDRGAILAELALRNDIRSGAIANHTSAVSDRRQQYQDAFYHRNGASFNTNNSEGGVDGSVNLPQDDSLPACDSFWSFCPIVQGVAAILGAVVTFLGWLVHYTASQAFNFAINLSVRNFGPSIADTPGVHAAWAVVRDLVNISFIFVLLYVAISTILQLASAQTKGLLTRVIIAALLVNFSMFFTGIMIDASNVVANSLYTMAAGNRQFQSWPDITTPLVSRMNFNQSLQDPNLVNKSTASEQLTAIIIQRIGQIILLAITCTVLFAGAVMFFARTIVLTFVLVFSPIAFLGIATGGAFKDLVGRWQKALTNQLIFAPAYLLCIFLTIQIVTKSNQAASIAGGAGLLATLVLYVIINGLMLGSLMVAKNLSVAGAALGAKLGGGITGYGTKIMARTTTGALGGAARGLYGGGLKQVLTGKDAEGNKVGIAGRVRGLGATLSTGVLSGVAGGATAGAKAGSEAIRTGGTFVKAVTTAVKRPGEALNEAVAAGTGIKFLGQTRDDEKEQKKRDKEEKEAKGEQKRKNKEDELKQISGSTPKETTDKTLTSEEKALQAKHQKAVQEVGDKDIVKIDPDTLVKLAHLLSESQIKALSDNKDGLSPKDFKQVKNAREALLMKAIKESRTNIIDSEVNKMNTNTLARFLGELNEAEANKKAADDREGKTPDFNEIINAISSRLTDKDYGELVKKDISRGRLVEIRKRMGNAETSPGTRMDPTEFIS